MLFLINDFIDKSEGIFYKLNSAALNQRCRVFRIGLGGVEEVLEQNKKGNKTFIDERRIYLYCNCCYWQGRFKKHMTIWKPCVCCQTSAELAAGA